LALGLVCTDAIHLQGDAGGSHPATHRSCIGHMSQLAAALWGKNT
jgi:hypothetical protein